jgi:hypothetical protein
VPTANIDLLPDQYADFYPTYLWTAAGVPVNLTGATARLMVRQNPNDATPMLSISSTPNATGSVVLGGVAGTVQINITKGKATPALSLAPLPPHYDLLIDWPGGITTELMSGQFVVSPGWTHTP